MKSVAPAYVLLASVFAFATAACSDSDGTPADSDPSAGGAAPGAGGGANPGAGGSTGAPPNAGDPLTPDPTGWVDPTTNDLGIQGAWYAYDDCKDSPGDCTTDHQPPEGSFPNEGGKMCTSGATATVNTEAEFSMKWGAGIALDLNNSGGEMGMKMPYDAAANGVRGFTFTLSGMAPGLRVNFPTPATSTDSHFKAPAGTGQITVLFSEAQQGSWVTNKSDLDQSQILAIQFQIPSVMGMAVNFDFCIENLAPVL